MNTDPLCGRTIENVMTTDNSVYQSIYLETKNNEPFPEYDSKIEELENLKEKEIQKALIKNIINYLKIQKKYLKSERF